MPASRVKLIRGAALLLAALPSAANAETLKDVNRILRANCTACHNVTDAQAGLDLTPATLHDKLVDRPATGAKAKLVVPGDPAASYLLAKMLDTQQSLGGTGMAMPIGARLDDEDLDVVRRWIAAGAKP